MLLNKLSERVYYTDYDEVSDRPIIGYVKGDKHSLLIDAGSSKFHADHVRHLLEEANLPYPDFIILTHSHWDHTYGLHSWNAVSFANTVTENYLKKDLALKWDKDSFKYYVENNVLDEFITHHMNIEYPEIEEVTVTLPDITFFDYISFDLGGITVSAIKAPSSHSDDGNVVLVEQDRLLFLGDSMSGELVGNDWVDHPELIKKYHDQLTELDFTHAIPSHTPILTRDEFLENLESRY